MRNEETGLQCWEENGKLISNARQSEIMGRSGDQNAGELKIVEDLS